MSGKIVPLHILAVITGGFVLHIAFLCSGGASWSLLVSSINNSAWELTKPFALVFIMWSFIEMACHRPHLLHYVSVRILSLHLFMLLSLLSLSAVRNYTESEGVLTAVISLCICAAEVFNLFAYNRKCRFELFFVPIIVSFIMVFFTLLFCSVYPLPIFFFK